MTSPYARPAEPPEDANADATIPLVPDYGYDQPSQPAFADETLVEPLGAGGWPDTSGQQYGYSPTPTPSAGTAPAPTPAYGEPYRQPTYGQPAPAPSPAQSNYTQPTYASTGWAEPSGPAEGVAPQPAYQGYPTPGQAPAVPVPYAYGYQQNLPEHPSATTTFVLSLVGLFVLQILCPIAWYTGAKAQREVKANPGRWRTGGLLSAGTIIGMIGTVFMALVLIFLFFIFAMVVASS